MSRAFPWETWRLFQVTSIKRELSLHFSFCFQQSQQLKTRDIKHGQSV